MNSPLATYVNFPVIVANLKNRWRWWAIPAATLTVLALGYAIVKPTVWQARQALVVRDEAVGDLGRQGRFDNSYALKTAQEMVLEVARHRSVVEAALRAAGTEDGEPDSDWPATDDIRDLQDALSVTAPQGAEFGQTEVIYLSVKSDDRQRAVVLTSAVCDQLERRLQDLRRDKAKSVIAELERTVSLAKKDLDEATGRLQKIETTVGSDLGELRTLSEAGAGDSNLRASLNQIKTDLRQATANRKALEEQFSLLQAARLDEKQLVGASGRLLDSQPTLRRLKDGLIDAQLRTATLRGSRNPDHPQVGEAVAAEEEVRQRLQHELNAALAGLQADLRVGNSQIKIYEEQLAEVTARLDRLASLRAAYSNLQADVRQRSSIAEKAQQDLATARASQAAAGSSSLITRLEAPLADDRPLGPGRATIVLVGMLGGLATGFGLLFLTAPVGRQLGRRCGDYLGIGRRASDRQLRAGEQPPAGQRAGEGGRGRRTEDRSVDRRAASGKQGRRANDVGAARTEAQTNAPDPALEPRTVSDSFSLTETLSQLVSEANRHS